MFDNVKNSFLKFGNFSDEELSTIAKRLKNSDVKKDIFLIKEGQTCNHFYFIERGSFKHYSITENGDEAIINLFAENEWMFDYKSLIAQKPSDSFIQAMEDSHVFELSLWDLHELIKESDSFFRVGHIFEVAVQNQDYQNNKISPEEKYAMLLASKPQIIQKFPLKYIASYLGIAPETLSRIRRKIIS